MPLVRICDIAYCASAHAAFCGSLVVGYRVLEAAPRGILLHQHLRIIELRQEVAGLGRRLHQCISLLLVLLDEAPVKQQQRILELRLRNALLGSALIPFRRSRLITLHAKTARQDFRDQRLRGRVAVLGERQSQIVSGPVKPALECAKRLIAGLSAEPLRIDDVSVAGQTTRKPFGIGRMHDPVAGLRCCRVAALAAVRAASGAARHRSAKKNGRKQCHSQPDKDAGKDQPRSRRGFVENGVGGA